MAWCANATHRRNVDKPVDDDASSEPANEEAEVEIEDTEEISAAASKETRLYLWYKRKMITEGQDVAKTSIEPVQVYEEISKIEQQIIDIIESKQNIINRTADSSDGSECCWNDSQLVADSMTDYTGGSLVVPRERLLLNVLARSDHLIASCEKHNTPTRPPVRLLSYMFPESTIICSPSKILSRIRPIRGLWIKIHLFSHGSEWGWLPIRLLILLPHHRVEFPVVLIAENNPHIVVIDFSVHKESSFVIHASQDIMSDSQAWITVHGLRNFSSLMRYYPIGIYLRFTNGIQDYRLVFTEIRSVDQAVVGTVVEIIGNIIRICIVPAYISNAVTCKHVWLSHLSLLSAAPCDTIKNKQV
ncbi:hypothetical protein HUJ05_007373 [Dendroctonus ponderosae]|nr:hypothetical protein HUJ05_007373 [Dendroctonus ponderosae]